MDIPDHHVPQLTHLNVECKLLEKDRMAKQRDFKSAFFSRPREKWHMMEKMPILIFRPEIPYGESINVVYFLGSQLSVFSRKFSKTVSSAHRRKMPEINAASTDTKTLLLDIAKGSRIF